MKDLIKWNNERFEQEIERITVRLEAISLVDDLVKSKGDLLDAFTDFLKMEKEALPQLAKAVKIEFTIRIKEEHAKIATEIANIKQELAESAARIAQEKKEFAKQYPARAAIIEKEIAEKSKPAIPDRSTKPKFTERVEARRAELANQEIQK
jgi:hydrogenase maturation factor HypF (carbamoyltransferase family)